MKPLLSGLLGILFLCCLGAPARSQTSNCIIPRDATWTQLARGDDNSSAAIPLGFTFSLYGTNYTSLYINNNGNLSFLAPVATFSSSGFPFNVPMVAPFWADVDTRISGTSCTAATQGGVYYKNFGTRFVVTWENVGYFSAQCGLRNTFQVVISDINDPLYGIGGQNVLFNYGDMQWTTGSASGGVGGFGGTPATVGINKGDGVHYVQIGRFDQNNSNYDGGGGNNDGVNYLDNKCFAYNVVNDGNIPPSFVGGPAGNTVDLNCNQTANYTIQANPGEVGQTVTAVLNTGGLCGVSAMISNGPISTVNLSIQSMPCNAGTHTISLIATDNGTPAASDTLNITLNITSGGTPPTITPAGPVTLCSSSVLLSSSAATGNQWSRNGSPIGGATGQTYSATLTGSYTVSAGCGGASAPVVVSADNQAPVAHCKSGYTLALASGTGTVLPANIDSLSTDNCSIASYAVVPNTFTCANPGPTQVTLIVTDGAGLVDSCHTTVTAQYPVTSVPVAVVPSSTVNTGGIPTNLYLGYGAQTDTLKAGGMGGSGFTYSWYPAADLSCTNCQSPVISPAAAGTYVRNVIATNSNGCADTGMVTICVRDLRVPGTSGKNFYICHQQSATSTSQTLSVTTNLLSQHLGQHPYDRMGQCNIPSTTSVCSGAMLRTLAPVEVLPPAVLLYPNPNSGSFTVELPYIAEDAVIVVTDLQGRMISSRQVGENDAQKQRFDLDAAPGMYFVQVVDGGIRQQFKVMIQ